MKRIALATVILAAACASQSPASTPVTQTAPREISAAELIDHEGDSPDTAVLLPADAPNDGVDFENDWIFDRVGRFHRLSQGTGTMQGRRYDVIEVETPAGDKRKLYFDITENWKKWRLPR